ncbi:MAG: branched-chain amino acid ABC transporter permease [Proteobacteria bacterium]|nr:branched-chain amino acid ABC transporter permease [Pseudomonadota bacterium]
MYRPCGVFDETFTQDLAIVRTKAHWGLVFFALAFLVCLPALASGALLANMNAIGITIISVLGLQIVVGYTGQISLGQAAFMSVGSYTAFMLSTYLKAPFLIALPLSGLTTGLAGLVFGLPSLRIKGFYLAMATLAAQFIIPWLIVNVRPDLTGGTSTMVVQPPRIFGYKFHTQQHMFYLIMAVVVLSIYLTKNLVRTRVGRAFVAVRDNDLAAEVMGVSILRYKLSAFFVSSFYAGLAGGLWAYWMRCVSVDHFTLMDSIWFLGMLVVGGMGSISGAVMGTIFIRVLDILVKAIGPWLGEFFPSLAGAATAALAPTVFGLIMMLFLVFEPRGLAHMWERVKSFYRLWPFSY